MTPEHCKAIIDNLPIVKAVAKGRTVYFAAFRYDGKFIEWRPTTKLLLAPLGAGYYSLKPRYSCMRPGKPPTAIPYPHQGPTRRTR